jgi:hypothetical protein
LAGTADQLWVATTDVRGGARLTNLHSGLALYGRPGQGDASWVGAGPVDLSVSGGCWVLDAFPSDGFHRIQCLPPSNNWFMQFGTEGQLPSFILAGWNGGQGAEFQVMPETGSVTVTNIQYNLAAAKNTPLPPVDFLAVVVDNTQNSIPLTQTITLTGSVQQNAQIQSSESDTEGTVYTQTFSVSATFAPVEVTASATFEENQSKTVGWSSSTGNTSTSEHDIQTEVTVPGNKKYSLQQRVNYGQVDVPWTATGTFQSCVASTKPYAFQMGGRSPASTPPRARSSWRTSRWGSRAPADRVLPRNPLRCRFPATPPRRRRCEAEEWTERVSPARSDYRACWVTGKEAGGQTGRNVNIQLS